MRDIEEVENAAVSWAQAAADWRRQNALNVAAKRKTQEAQLSSVSDGHNSDRAADASMVDLREADQALRV